MTFGCPVCGRIAAVPSPVDRMRCMCLLPDGTRMTELDGGLVVVDGGGYALKVVPSWG